MRRYKPEGARFLFYIPHTTITLVIKSRCVDYILLDRDIENPMSQLQSFQTDIVSPRNKENYVRDIYLQHREELCRYIMNKCGVKFSEAEDIVHTAFAR